MSRIIAVLLVGGLAACGGAETQPISVGLPSAAEPVVVAAGDIACNTDRPPAPMECHHRQTLGLVARLDPAAVLVLGDNQYPAGRPQDYERYFGTSWGELETTIYPTPGNHDYLTPEAAGYFGYFFGGVHAGHEYYSFDLGSWHVVSLDSEIDRGPGSAQLRWLREDLATSTKPCVLAFWHRPRWSSGSGHGEDPSVNAFWTALDAAGADVVLNGHEHVYERFAPQDPAGAADPAGGARQFTVGTGGRSLYSFSSPKPNSEVRYSDSFGVLRLVLRTSGYEWRFVAEPGSTFSDAGTAVCH